MALGTDMKSLVDNILASREDRAKALGGIRRDTKHIQADAQGMMKDFAKEGEERVAEVKKSGQEVRSFLRSATEGRKADFGATMKTVHESLENVRKDSKRARDAWKTIMKDARALVANISKGNEEQAKALREGLKKNDHHRKTESNALMENIGKDLKELKAGIAKVRKDTRDLVSRCYHSRKSAQKHWASLSQERKDTKKQKSEKAEKSGE